jgi:hypothetical protein
MAEPGIYDEAHGEKGCFHVLERKSGMLMLIP